MLDQDSPVSIFGSDFKTLSQRRVSWDLRPVADFPCDIWSMGCAAGPLEASQGHVVSCGGALRALSAAAALPQAAGKAARGLSAPLWRR